MNLWLKPNPAFDSDDALDKFLFEARGLIMMFDAPRRYMYQDLPKFLVYTCQMFMPNFGDKSEIPYHFFGKQNTEMASQKTEESQGS